MDMSTAVSEGGGTAGTRREEEEEEGERERERERGEGDGRSEGVNDDSDSDSLTTGDGGHEVDEYTDNVHPSFKRCFLDGLASIPSILTRREEMREEEMMALPLFPSVCVFSVFIVCLLLVEYFIMWYLLK